VRVCACVCDATWQTARRRVLRSLRPV